MVECDGRCLIEAGVVGKLAHASAAMAGCPTIARPRAGAGARKAPPCSSSQPRARPLGQAAKPHRPDPLRSVALHAAPTARYSALRRSPPDRRHVRCRSCARPEGRSRPAHTSAPAGLLAARAICARRGARPTGARFASRREGRRAHSRPEAGLVHPAGPAAGLWSRATHHAADTRHRPQELRRRACQPIRSARETMIPSGPRT